MGAHINIYVYMFYTAAFKLIFQNDTRNPFIITFARTSVIFHSRKAAFALYTHAILKCLTFTSIQWSPKLDYRFMSATH